MVMQFIIKSERQVQLREAVRDELELPFRVYFHGPWDCKEQVSSEWRRGLD